MHARANQGERARAHTYIHCCYGYTFFIISRHAIPIVFNSFVLNSVTENKSL